MEGIKLGVDAARSGRSGGLEQMPTKEELYGIEARLGNQRVNLEASNLSDGNKDVLRRFFEFGLARNVSPLHAAKQVQEGMRLAEMFGRDFEGATRTEIEALVAAINRRQDWRPANRQKHRCALRQLYRFLLCSEEMPDLVKWIPTGLRRADAIPPLKEKELLTNEDVTRVLAATHTPVEHAFVSVLFESGARIGELLLLERSAVSFKDDLAYLAVDGKTGPRDVMLVASVPALRAYLDATSLEAADGPLWLQDRPRDGGQRHLTRSNVKFMLGRLFKRAGLAKKRNPHHWRHSRCSLDALNGMGHAQMCAYFGWRFSSPMPDRYIHISARSLEPVIRQLHAPGAQGGLLRGLQVVARIRSRRDEVSARVSSQAETVSETPGETRRVDREDILDAMLRHPDVRTVVARLLQRGARGDAKP